MQLHVLLKHDNFALVTLLNRSMISHHGVQLLHSVVVYLAWDCFAFTAQCLIFRKFSTVVVNNRAISKSDENRLLFYLNWHVLEENLAFVLANHVTQKCIFV